MSDQFQMPIADHRQINLAPVFFFFSVFFCDASTRHKQKKSENTTEMQRALGSIFSRGMTFRMMPREAFRRF